MRMPGFEAIVFVCLASVPVEACKKTKANRSTQKILAGDWKAVDLMFQFG